jgi:DNA-binding NarL/FixJ family response regulator
VADRPGSSLRVLLVDDEPLVRQGLRLILEAEPDLLVVGEADSGAEAVTLARALEPDVVCMDVRMPDVDGIRATELVLRLPRPPKVLVVTTFSSDDFVLGALRAGAAGFVLKRARAPELVAAVRAVAVGDSLLYPDAVRALALAAYRPPVRRDAPALTRRETEVLALVAQGLSNAEVAARLVLGTETVRTHVAALLRKLGARDRTQAVVLAYEAGLVDLGRPR